MRAVITVTGTDRKGVVAQVGQFLFEKNINIKDMSQTVLGDRFAMVMIIDTEEGGEDFSELAADAERMGREIGMTVRLQHADLFDAMHNV